MGLRDWRKAAGLTQAEIARMASVSRAAVSHVETKRIPPSAGFAGKVCRALSHELGMQVHTWDVFPDEFTNLQTRRAG
jgi:transcriptional regulator with XRE-family HTH domain